MAKKNQVYIDIIVDDKGTTKRVAVDAKKLGVELDKSARASDKGAKGADKLSRSQKNLDRNMRGTAKMSTNQTKEFSKMQQGMGGLVGTYATLAAQVFAVSAAFQFLSSASDFRNLVRGQEALGAATGTTYKTISNAIVEATDAQLLYADAAKGAAIGVAAGLQSSQLTRLAEAAKNTSFALGRDLTDSYNRLIRGVTKAEPELLDELGIILRLEPATKKYAQSIGKIAGELNAFERTQAVANEVLEQAERKFGAIGDQMDPSSTALARFQKSFDELVNTFKIGLIDVLSPVFTFLSKNTMALTAALALFAIPILKAIIPGLNQWAEAQKEVYAQHNKRSKEYKAQMKQNATAFKVFNDAQNKGLRESQETAQKLAKGRGTKGSGMNFLTGEGKGRAADANRILAAAEKQTADGKKVLRGTLKGYNALEVADLRKSYDRRVALAGTATTKIKGFWASTGQVIKVVSLGVASAWSKAMAGMVAVARGAAKAINMAMAAASLIGVLMLLYSMGTAVKDFLYPLSAKMQEENDKIAAMAEHYKTLNKEMALNAAARKDRLIGSEITMAEGATLQGADIGKVISDLRTFRGTRSSAEGYKETRKDLEGVTKQLAILDPQFSVLQDFLEGTGDISIEFGKKLVQVANDAIELGNELRQLPQILKDADTAFTDLGKSLISVTPLSSYIDKQKKALEIIEKNIKATKDSSDRLSKIQADAVAADTKAAEDFEANNKFLLARIAIYDKLGESNIMPIGAFFRVLSWRTRSEFGIDSKAQKKEAEEIALKQAKIDEERAAAALQTIEDDRKELEERTAILELANNLEILIIGNRMKQTEELKKQTEMQTLGLTIEGRLQNLGMDAVKRSAALLKAEEGLATAKFSKEGKTGVELGIALRKITQAEANLELVKSQNRFEEEITEQKRRQLWFTQQMMGLVNANILAGETASSFDIETSRQKGLRAKTRGTTSYLRGREGTKLAQTITDNTAAELLAQELYINKLHPRMQELYEIEEGDPAGSAAIGAGWSSWPVGSRGGAALKARREEADAELYDKTEAKNYRAAQRKSAEGVRAQADFDAASGVGGTFLTEQIKGEKDLLAIQAQGLVLGRGRQEAARLLAEYEAKYGEAGPAIIARYEEEGHAIAEQKILLEGIAKVRDAIENSMAGAFQALIEGTKTAKQAFGDMARSILSMITQMFAKMLTFKILSASMFGGFFDPVLPKTEKVRYGGIVDPPRGYGRGGVARGRDAGYGAVLHGTEAVVPLPNNRSIPVDLKGGIGQNTVNVAVNISGQGSSVSATGGGDAAALGRSIGGLVQQHLQTEMRPGGLLNRQGATGRGG